MIIKEKHSVGAGKPYGPIDLLLTWIKGGLSVGEAICLYRHTFKGPF